MAQNSLMTIRELLTVANRVKGYTAASLATKEMGAVYAFNKVLNANPKHSIIEVSMLIKGVTDMVGIGAYKRPVTAHRVQLRINDVPNEEVTGTTLVNRIRKLHPSYSDPSKVSRTQILEEVRAGKEFFKNKIIVETNKVILETVRPTEIRDNGDGTATEVPVKSTWKFAIIDKHINVNCKVQVRCSCSSYYWTFQYPNAMNNVDIEGKKGAIPYDKYKMSGHPRNPKDSPGLCKHLMLLLGMLMHDNVINSVKRGMTNPATVYELNISKFRNVNRMSRTEFRRLVKNYKDDLIRKTNQRNDRWFDPKKPAKRKKTYWQRKVKGK